MAATLPVLPVLPDDILLNVFSYLDKRKFITAAMLVDRRWYHLAEGRQYSDLVLDFLFGQITTGSIARPSGCLQTLNSRLSAARALRHLAVSGVSTAPIRALLMEVLAKTTGLLSLDIRIDEYMLGEECLFANAQSLCASTQFLPNLSALFTNDARIVGSLTAGRPLYAVGIPKMVDVETYTSISNSLVSSASALTQLSVYVEVDNMAATVRVFESIAENLPALVALSIQFRLTNPDPVTWTTVENAIHRMEACLARLNSLDVLSLAYIPEPIDKAARYEAETKRLAEIIVSHAPQLRRIELRWHGWYISGGIWSPVHRSELLRQPGRWLYTETRHRLSFSRNVIR